MRGISHVDLVNPLLSIVLKKIKYQKEILIIEIIVTCKLRKLLLNHFNKKKHYTTGHQ